MPDLASLTDATVPQQDTGLPVEQPYRGPNLGPIQGATDGTIGNTDIVVPVAAPPVTIQALPRPEPMPVIPADPQDFSPDATVVGSNLDKIINRLTGANGEQRYQLWPEKVVREGLSAAHDAMTEGLTLPGLRREDYTDIPSPDMPTNDSTWLGQKLGMAPVAASPADTAIGQAQSIAALAGTGGVAGTGEELGGATLGVVPVDIAKKLNFKTGEAPDILKSAVENTPAASIDQDGHLIVNMVRHQMSDQDGAESVRGGVFYLPEGSPNARYYNGSTNNYYGGQDKIQGQTAYKNPLVVKGATGGKAPEAAYNKLMGDKKAYDNLNKDVMEIVSANNWMKRKDPAAFDELTTRFFEKHNPEMLDYKDYILDNSKQGNQLKYALSEGAIARAARVAGHDGIVGYSVGRGVNKGKPFLSEIFDTRESHYPSPDGNYRVHPSLYSDNQAGLGIQAGKRAFLRPALKFDGKIYKAPVGGQHLDALPAHLAQDFQAKALSGDDINDYQFGFMNHKGQFLDREKALDYAVKEGLVDPSAGRFGALTSTLLADSSKPGTAIEAMAKAKYPLAKPSDRWTNTLGQNDALMQNMTPDEFLNQSRPLKIDEESRENIDALKQHIQEGKPLDPLELHANGKEDGRHRAIAAKELGIKQVPVINFRPKFDFAPGESSGSRSVKLGPTEITYGVNPKNNDVELSLLRTDKNQRGQGNGRAAIEQFLKEADASNKRVLLNADPMDKSTSKAKLESFYKSLGFVRNTGRNKDFTTRAEYIREPKTKYIFKPVDYNPFENKK